MTIKDLVKKDKEKKQKQKKTYYFYSIHFKNNND